MIPKIIKAKKSTDSADKYISHKDTGDKDTSDKIATKKTAQKSPTQLSSNNNKNSSDTSINNDSQTTNDTLNTAEGYSQYGDDRYINKTPPSSTLTSSTLKGNSKNSTPQSSIKVWDDFVKNAKKEYVITNDDQIIAKEIYDKKLPNNSLAIHNFNNTNQILNSPSKFQDPNSEIQKKSTQTTEDSLAQDDLQNDNFSHEKTERHLSNMPPSKKHTRDKRYKPNTNLSLLEQSLGYTFKNQQLLTDALTHRSFASFRAKKDYERLEFLGDAVFELTVAHLLHDRYPDSNEGELSKMRASLVNTQSLASIAKNLKIPDFIIVGRTESKSFGNEKISIMADVMESVIGAIYLDSDYNNVKEIIERYFGVLLEKVIPFDPKTELQEVLHLNGSNPPEYLLEHMEGPGHAPTFVTIVVIDGEVMGRGRGSNKKSAQQVAATEALAKMQPDYFEIKLTDAQNFFIKELVQKPKPPVDIKQLLIDFQEAQQSLEGSVN